MITKVGLVIIGRNEAKHLKKNLPALPDLFTRVVFVDSDSSDDSVQIAKENKIDVIELDMSIPFSAARARNTGFQLLLDKAPDLEFVQFLDGDCALDQKFPKIAVSHFLQQSQVGIVVGRNRERYPEHSIYNAICDVEWNTPIGELDSCGGIFMIRANLMSDLEGFNASVVAGEEPELCVRVKNQGFIIERLDAEMSLHDANMTKFSQWWLRAVRSGHAYAQVNKLHGEAPVFKYKKEILRLIIFSLFGLFSLILAVTVHWGFIAGLLIYLLQAARIYIKKDYADYPEKVQIVYSLSCGFAYIPQFYGLVKFHWRRLTGKQATIIEYK